MATDENIEKAFQKTEFGMKTSEVNCISGNVSDNAFGDVKIIFLIDKIKEGESIIDGYCVHFLDKLEIKLLKLDLNSRRKHNVSLVHSYSQKGALAIGK